MKNFFVGLIICTLAILYMCVCFELARFLFPDQDGIQKGMLGFGLMGFPFLCYEIGSFVLFMRGIK